MKIAIPIANGKLCMHFGHCEQFAIVNVNEKTNDIESTEYLVPPPHEPGILPKWLHQEIGADLVISGGMGMRAKGLFENNNIKVVVGASPEVPEKIVDDFLNNRLVVGDNACDH